MKIKFAIFDFDGVFTDGKCFFDNNNKIIKYYNIKDGMGISELKKNNIKTGLLSSYKSKFELQLNDNISIQNLKEHLNFDYFHIGKGNKLEILNNWLDENNIKYDEVAYIGDDINDLCILELVGLSGCPNNAIDECKEIVSYVCKKNGGEGCVREFIDYILKKNKLSENDILINEIKKESLYQLKNINFEEINKIINLIEICKGNIYFTGIGKSEIMAEYCCCLLKSIGIKTFF